MGETGEGVECYITRGVSEADRKHAKKDSSSFEGIRRSIPSIRYHNIDLE